MAACLLGLEPVIVVVVRLLSSNHLAFGTGHWCIRESAQSVVGMESL